MAVEGSELFVTDGNGCRLNQVPVPAKAVNYQTPSTNLVNFQVAADTGDSRARHIVPATSFTHIYTHLNPRCLSYMASYDVASNICQETIEHRPPRHRHAS